MRGLNSLMHASYWGTSSYFRAWQTSRNLLQSCFADTFIFVLQTWKPLLGPCALQQPLLQGLQKLQGSCPVSPSKHPMMHI